MALLLNQTYSTTTEVLSTLRQSVRGACLRAGCREEVCEQIVLAINEASMNIIQHGYAFASRQDFALQISVNDGVLVANLMDNGRPVAEDDWCPRDLDDLRPGGLGVRFIRELMEDVAYVPAPEGFTNCLQLTKRIC